MTSEWAGDAAKVVQVGHVHGDLNVGSRARRSAPVEIASLMRAHILMAEQLPYRLRGARTPSLSTVYVRQDLGSGGDELTSDEARPRPMVDGHGQLVDVATTPRVRTSVRPPSRTVREALETDDHLVITGGPGQGKSTLALRLAADLALSWSGHGTAPVTERVVPLRLPARELAARLDVPFAEALAASARAEYNVRLKCAIDPAHFEDRVSGCRWLLLVDGLDEVTSPADREDLVHALAGWADSGEVYRIVLTTRPIEGGVLAPLQRIGAVRYELQPFDEDALRTFAVGWFEDDGDAATSFLRQIRKAYLDELVRVPLLATIAAIIFEQRREHPLPDNQYELYEAYLRYLRTGHPHRPSPLDPHRDALLEHLGRIRVDADTSLLGAARSWATSRVDGDWQDDLVRFLTAVGPFTLRADDVQFLHHSFADHLAATARARLLPVQFSADHNDFAHLLHAARPREHGRHARRVLLHYGRLHPPQADVLLGALNAGDSEQHLLAARLLAGHLPAGPHVVDTFLATVRGWAMTTHYNAYDILAGASRATHHPGLSDWLAGLMDDDRAPLDQPDGSRGRPRHTTTRHPRTSRPRTPARRCHRPRRPGRTSSDRGRGIVGVRRTPTSGGGTGVAGDPRRPVRDATRTPRRRIGDGIAGRRSPRLRHQRTPGRHDRSRGLTRAAGEAAHGLVEITVEHADRCAEVLAELLRTGSAWNGTGPLETAADTFASLGPRHAAVGVRALVDRIVDVRQPRWERAVTAATLARIGPSCRATAAELILEVAAEPGVSSADRWRLGEMLGDCGGEYREQAASLLLRVLSGVGTGMNTFNWAARALCELGPDYQSAAVHHLWHFSEAIVHPYAVHWELESALGTVASAAGEPHRSRALAELRANLADKRVELKRRDRATYEFIDLGPEFHGEAVGPLRELATQRFNLDVTLSAWRNLAKLDSGFRTQAAAAWIGMMACPEEDDSTPPGGMWFTSVDFDDLPAAGDAALRVLEDADRDERWRSYAARCLIMYGQPFHRAAVRGLIDLIRSEAVPRTRLREWVRGFGDLSGAFRAEITRALCEKALSVGSTTPLVVNAAEAMAGQHPPELLAALREILFAEATDPDLRVRTAVMVASTQPELAGAAADVVIRDQRERRFGWDSELCDLVLLGADPVPGLHAVAADADVRVAHRLRAASVLVRLGRREVAKVLRQHADDEYLEHNVRVHALSALAEHSEDDLPGVLGYHQRVRDDGTAAISDRCESAHRARELDRTATSAAVELLQSVASNQELSPDERASAIPHLHVMTHHRTVVLDFLARAIAHDPASSAAVWKSTLDSQAGKPRSAGQRAMLADRSIALEHRLPALDDRGFLPLRRETEAAVRDVLSAPESTHRERVAAAAALAQLSSRFVGEAAELLGGLGWRGQEELAKLGPRWSSQVFAAARATAADETRPWRERWQAARLVWTGVEPRSAEQRMEWAEARGEIGVLRAMLGHARPAMRWRAAKRLREYDFADRVAGARVLEEIGRDPGATPALRWRAGEELTRFGAKGRESGVAVLRDIMGDAGLPVMARIEAASVVGKIRPDLRAQVVRFLRGVRADKPLQRIKLYQAIGMFEPEEGARALWAMAESRAEPVVKIRAAEAMLGLRRDYRERAAITARNVLRDVKAPQHVRRRAAGDLARWSDLCLEEARAVLA